MLLSEPNGSSTNWSRDFFGYSWRLTNAVRVLVIAAMHSATTADYAQLYSGSPVSN